MSLTPRTWSWAAFVLGAATLVLFVVFAMLPAMRAAAECLPAGSVVQFELARSVADLVAIFGPADSACRPLAVAGMDAVNTLDVWAFIPTYTLFCMASAMYVARGEPRLLAFCAIAAAAGAAAGDYVETTALLQITQRLDDPGALLQQLQIGAWSKFALLAAHAFFLAGVCWNDAKRRPILGLLLLLPALGTAAAWIDHARYANLMNTGFALAWIGLFAFAGKEAFGPAPPAKGAQP